jgi:hypothetical protein
MQACHAFAAGASVDPGDGRQLPSEETHHEQVSEVDQTHFLIRRQTDASVSPSHADTLAAGWLLGDELVLG